MVHEFVYALHHHMFWLLMLVVVLLGILRLLLLKGASPEQRERLKDDGIADAINRQTVTNVSLASQQWSRSLFKD